MTTVDMLLSELRRRDVKLWLEGDRLRYRAPEGAMSPDLLNQLRSQKAEILTFLNQAQAGTTIQRPPLVPVSRADTLLPSFAQQRLWLLQQFEPGTPANNMPVVVRFTGSFDVSVLERSLAEIIRRHEILRATFPIVDGQPSLVIAPELSVSVPVIDMRGVPKAQREAEVHNQASLAAKQPFDLVNGPVVWFKLFRLGESNHLLLWNMHAIVCDGTAADLFYRELITLYGAFAAGLPSPLSDLPIQYPDFAQWQRQWLQGEVLETYLNYWKQKLSGNLPLLLQLPADHPRPVGVQTYRGDRYARMLPQQLHHDLMRLSQQMGTTLFVTLLTTFNTLLYRYSQQSELLTTFVSSGRNQVETEALMGFFSNTLVLRTDFQGCTSFRDMIRQVHQSVLEAHTYQDVPFEKLVEELRPEQNQSRSPLYQIKFTLNPPWTNGRGMAAVELPNLTIKALFGYIYNGKTKFDLTLVMREQDEGLGVVFDFNADLFDTDTVERMMDHFQILLESIAVNPNQAIAELPLLTPSERQQFLNQNQPIQKYAVCLHQRFEAQAQENPAAIALVFNDQTLTYQELNQRANQLAHYLQQLNVQAADPVGILLERSPNLIVALLGILKVGGVCVSLDPTASFDTLSGIMEDAQPKIILTQSQLSTELSTDTSKLVDLDKKWQEIAEQSNENLDLSITTDHSAIVVYALEETNKFKSFYWSHHSLGQWIENSNESRATEVHLFWSDFALPTTHFTLWSSLSYGAKLVLLPHQASVTDLAIAIQHYHVTTVWLPTLLFHSLVANHLERLSSIRQLLVDSQPLLIAPVQTFLQTFPGSVLVQTWNLPQHAAWICTQTITPSILLRDAVPIGRPNSVVPLCVLDHHQKFVPIGISGELYINSYGLEEESFNSDSTESRLLPSSLQLDAKAHFHETGHQVRWLPDGTLELLGHRDDWMSIQGLPASRRQVETAIAKYPLIQEACILLIATDTGERYLVAYLVTQLEQAEITRDLRNYLKQKLPAHLIPSVFICLDKLPLKKQGSVDLSALPTAELASQLLVEEVTTAQDSVERKLMEIWQQLLGKPSIRSTDNFFDLGGDSLLAVRLFAQIEQKFQKNLPLATLLQAPTIESFAQVLRQKDNTEAWSPLVLIQEGGSKPPLFCIHGGGFNVLIYRALALNLGAEYPVYGLQARGLDGNGEKVSTRLEEIAADYIQQIRQVQPEGPYLLSGLSNGGNIAFEMAQQLHAQGQTVGLLALLDTYQPNSVKILPPFPRLLSSLKYGLQHSIPRFLEQSRQKSLGGILTELQKKLYKTKLSTQKEVERSPGELLRVGQDSHRPISPQSKWSDHWMDQISQYVLDHSPWSFFLADLLKEVEGSLSETLTKLEQVYGKAQKSYVPNPYPGKIALFRARESPPGFRIDPHLGWKKLAMNGIKVHQIPGHHTSIIRSPILAEKLRGYIDEI